MFLLDKIAICPANIVTAFRNGGRGDPGPTNVGSRVTNESGFWPVVVKAIKEFDWSTCRAPGQAFIQVPDAVPFVSSGVGRRTKDPYDYVLREHRGRVDAYLRRSMAAPAEGCAVVVYTIDAFGKDPEVDKDYYNALCDLSMTHVLVAVLAFAGQASPLSPYRFVANLAGGNNEAQTWTGDEIRMMAKDIFGYDADWCVVAD